jgi:hypothetical protein
MISGHLVKYICSSEEELAGWYHRIIIESIYIMCSPLSIQLSKHRAWNQVRNQG